MKLHALAISLLAISCAQVACAQDIAGIALGSPFSAAKATMLKVNGELKVSPLTRRDGTVAGLTAVSPKTTDDNGPQRSVDEFVILNESKGNVFYVARNQRYAPGSRIPEKTLIESLTKKFGKPSSMQKMMGTTIKWQWDRKGTAFTGPEGKGPCDQVGFAGMGNMSVSTPDRFSPDCGKMVMATWGMVSGDLIPGFSLLALDGKTIFDELNAKDIQAKAEQKKKLDDERNKGTKPQI